MNFFYFLENLLQRVLGLISYDTTVSKYLVIFRISPQMDVIFLDILQEIVQKSCEKTDSLTIMGN